MKKLFLILFLVVGYFANGQILQEPNVYGYKFKRVGSDSLHFIPSDTLQVPTRYNGLSFIANKGGALYYWNGTKWASFSSSGSSYTFTNGLTESGGTVKLGGPLTANTEIDVSGHQISFSDVNNFYVESDGATPLADLTELESSLTNINGSNIGKIKITGDSIIFYQTNGNYKFKNIPSTTSTTGRKVLVHDTATGKVERVDPALLRVVDTSYTTIATFTAGGGFASDTTMCTDSTLFGSFFTGQFDYTIAYIQAVIKGNAGDSIVLKLVYNDTFNVDGTKVNGAGLSLNNRYTGNVFTISTNRTIAANTWVWLKPEAVIIGKKPKYISVTLVGYKTYVTP